jgi:2-succinyl-6-hydroxy-2,4-cyclohexadiene-1-carboxylate synthase
VFIVLFILRGVYSREIMSTIIYAVPGTFCNIEIWDELLKSLPSNIEIMNIDIPVKSSVSEIVNFLDEQLPDQPSNLLGFSFGGFLISAFTLKFPHRVNKLLVISDSLDELEQKEIESRKQFVSFIESEGFSGLHKQAVTAVLHPSKKNDVALHVKIMKMSESMESIAVQNQMLATTTRGNIYENIGLLSKPTYIVFGDMDQTFNKGVLESLATDNFHYEEINESGHFLPLEQPSKLAKVVIRWSLL